MYAIKTTLIGAAALALAAPAFAEVSVENRTDQAHTVTFDKGAEEIRHEAAAGATVSEPCPDGCGVRFAGHDTMAADGDALAIVEGATQPVRAE